MDYQRFEVRTEDGVRGTLFARSRFLDSSPHKLVRLDNGREFMAPSELIRSQPDGSYLLALRADQLDQAEPPRPSADHRRAEYSSPEQGSAEHRVGEHRAGEHKEHAARESTVEKVIPVLEEELSIGRRTVPQGKVLIHKRVHSEKTMVEEPLIRDTYDIEKIPVNQVVNAPVEPFYDGDTLVLPVLEEVLVVEKRIVVREEWRIRRKREQRQDRQEVELRRETLDVEHSTR